MTCRLSSCEQKTQDFGLGPIWQDSRLSRLRTPEHSRLAEVLFDQLNPSKMASWKKDRDGVLNKDFWTHLKSIGAIGVSVPEDKGGRGLGALGTAIVSDAAHQTLDCGLASALRIQNEIAAHWLCTAFGSHVFERYGSKVVSGDLIACVCQTETEHVWRSTGLVEDDLITINAEKSLIVNYKNSDILIVTVKVGESTTAVVVDKDTPGVHLRKSHPRWGANLVDQVDLSLKDVVVPVSNILTKGSLQSTLQWNRVMCRARLTLAMDALAVLVQLIQEAVVHLRSRNIYIKGVAAEVGRSEQHQVELSRAIARAHTIRNWIVNQIFALESGRFAVQSAARLRWYSVNEAVRFARYCFELRGGRAYLPTDVFHRLYAQVAGLSMSGGSQEVLLRIVQGGSEQLSSKRRRAG